MQDFYLKFDSEEQARSVLYRIEGAVEADPENNVEAKEGYEVPNFMNIDIIGTITEGGEYNEEGEVVVEPTALPGYHVTVRVMPGEDASVLQEFAIHPATPMRVWG